MATLIQDDFNRTNNTTVIGSPTVGGPYTNQNSGVSGILSNQGYYSTVNATLAGSHTTFPGAVDIDLTCTMPAWSTSVASGLIVRWVDNANMWLLGGINGQALSLSRCVAGVYTAVWSTPGILCTANDVSRIVCYGPNMFVYHNARLVAVVPDPYYGNGASTAGILSRGSAGRFDNLLGIDSSDPFASGYDFNPIKGTKTRTEDEGSDF